MSEVAYTKEERMNAILEPRYSNSQIWHYRGGNCQILEEELILNHPPHDDVKDCLSQVIGICVAPMRRRSGNKRADNHSNNIPNTGNSGYTFGYSVPRNSKMLHGLYKNITFFHDKLLNEVEISEIYNNSVWYNNEISAAGKILNNNDMFKIY